MGNDSAAFPKRPPARACPPTTHAVNAWQRPPPIGTLGARGNVASFRQTALTSPFGELRRTSGGDSGEQMESLAYIDEYAPLMAYQLAEAGSRLAQVLNQTLSKGEP